MNPSVADYNSNWSENDAGSTDRTNFVPQIGAVSIKEHDEDDKSFMLIYNSSNTYVVRKKTRSEATSINIAEELRFSSFAQLLSSSFS